jgi:hypothetical protein
MSANEGLGREPSKAGKRDRAGQHLVYSEENEADLGSGKDGGGVFR